MQSEITMPAISLLMESVRLQDELPLLKERVPDPARVFRQKAAHLAWEEPDTIELAAAVWSRLKKGASLEDLQREVPRSLVRDLPDGRRPPRRRADRVGPRPASDPGGLPDLLPDAAGPRRAPPRARRVIRVIALRLARKDQFAASRSSPETTAIPTAFTQQARRERGALHPHLVEGEDHADADPVGADAEAGPGVGELGLEPGHELLVLAERVAQRARRRRAPAAGGRRARPCAWSRTRRT